MAKKKLSRRIIALIVCLSIVGALLLFCLGLQIAFTVADGIECWRPDYEQLSEEEMLQLIENEDYDALYRQTGLTQTGIKRALAKGERGIERILEIQDDFFAEHKVENDFFAPFVCTDFIEKQITNIYLEDGDILVTSSTHLSGWRMGHAGLVTNSSLSQVLQANAIGSTSNIGTVGDFTTRVNFMVLSPKNVDGQTKAKVAEAAEKNLQGKVYDPTAGVFSSKNKCERTQCAHIVWYAYKSYAGIDIDGNGGLVVTPKNIANSPEMELVQVFGFDIDKLWR
ncbi:MAG: hypothetical protein K2I30_06900 [Clostridia bacterium]|nr:hypothetical protein [Clostridia bacterium]